VAQRGRHPAIPLADKDRGLDILAWAADPPFGIDERLQPLGMDFAAVVKTGQMMGTLQLVEGDIVLGFGDDALHVIVRIGFVCREVIQNRLALRAAAPLSYQLVLKTQQRDAGIRNCLAAGETADDHCRAPILLIQRHLDSQVGQDQDIGVVVSVIARSS